MSQVIVFLFHRDLRLEDNLPLQKALDRGKELGCPVLPVFIFTPQQVGKKAPVKSVKSIACLFQSLEDLDDDLQKKYKSGLCVLYEDNLSALRKIQKNWKIQALYETKDYTPFAKQREAEEEKFCRGIDAEFEAIDYLYMFAPGEILNKSGKYYQKFTPFYNSCLHKKVPKPEGWVKGNFVERKKAMSLAFSLKDMIGKILTKQERDEPKQQKGGRKEGLQLLHSIPKNYDTTHNQLAKETSHLSVHHHYGTVSIRESYTMSHGIKEFQRQLFWRDFYGQLMYVFDEYYHKKMGEWIQERPKLSKEQKELYEAWKEGETGLELLDAGMKQLNSSGFMHNRTRLVCASVLCKDWKLPWQYGAGYFAEKLLDYDFTQNTQLMTV